MDLRISHGLSDSLLPPRKAAAGKAPDSQKTVPSANLPAAVSSPASETSGTRLISETQDDIENGLRRTRVFEREDGRRFTRIEEITLTDKSARRTVIQQNPSGGITRYEEVLDRQGAGSFRRTQRFQDEGGEISTQITPDYKVTDPYILSGGYTPAFVQSSPFDKGRGTQLDLQV